MKRWITGIILALIGASLLLFAPIVVLKGFVVALPMVLWWEYIDLVTQKKARKIVKISGLILIGLIHFQASYSYLFYKSFTGVSVVIGTILNGLVSNYFILFFGFLIHFVGKENIEEKLKSLVFYIFGIFYIKLFIFVGSVLDLADQDQSRFLIFLTLATTYLADTGAYVSGKLFGKHLLAPRISPKKTIEGLIGGSLFSMGAALACYFLFYNTSTLCQTLGYKKIIILGFIVSIVGLLGDLAESFIKRAVGAKDSSQMIPGHGGFLDRFDALLFVAPAITALVVVFKFF